MKRVSHLTDTSRLEQPVMVLEDRILALRCRGGLSPIDTRTAAGRSGRQMRPFSRSATSRASPAPLGIHHWVPRWPTASRMIRLHDKESVGQASTTWTRPRSLRSNAKQGALVQRFWTLVSRGSLGAWQRSIARRARNSLSVLERKR